jgi:hypothetical protein
LQHQGDRPVRGGRPSLLSPDEQAAPERQGILSSLDAMPGQTAVAPGARPRPRALAWGGAAAGVIAVCGALFLFGRGDDGPAPAPAVAAAAATTVADARPAAAATPAPATPASVTPVSLPAPAASAPAVLRDEPAAPAGPLPNPLADMAESPAPAHHKAPAKAERGEAAAKAAHRKEHEAARDKTRDRTRGKTHDGAKEKKSKAGTAKEQDSDVVLLAALMSHMEPRRGKATPAEQLEACRRYNAAGEEQCRARVCETAGAKEPACKRVRAARAEPET